MLGVSVSKMKVLTVKMETVTLIGKGRQNVTRFVYCVYAIDSKIFFSHQTFHFWEIILDLDKYISPW
jgi:hypothetical protein